jgi:DNA transformation protein and related proteins
MAVSAETRAWVLELFKDLGDVSARAMMGGLAIYCRGQIFALYGGPEQKLYLKASGPLAEYLGAEGATQFRYTRKNGKTVRMRYWTLPDAAIDDTQEACLWARRALDAADPTFS